MSKWYSGYDKWRSSQPLFSSEEMFCYLVAKLSMLSWGTTPAFEHFWHASNCHNVVVLNLRALQARGVQGQFWDRNRPCELGLGPSWCVAPHLPTRISSWGSALPLPGPSCPDWALGRGPSFSSACQDQAQHHPVHAEPDNRMSGARLRNVCIKL